MLQGNDNDIFGHLGATNWRWCSIKINCAKENAINFFQNKKWYCHKDEEDVHPLNSKLKAGNQVDCGLIEVKGQTILRQLTRFISPIK